MHLARYINSFVAISALSLLISGCASVRGGVAVTNCVIPSPYVNASGKLELGWAGCTLGDGSEGKMPEIKTKTFVCHPSDDYFKVLEGRR